MGTISSKYDMAICLVIFNPSKSKRIIMNYLYTINQFQLKKLPFFTLELVFKDRTPEIPNAFHVYCDSFMFHKERMCRVLETKIPSKYKKLLFVDSDVIFLNSNWYTDISKLLDTHDVVQPFETCNWLDLTYTNVTLSRTSVLFMKEKEWNYNYHPGFAWAFRREWYRKVGFFDWALSGSGDTLSSAAWLGKQLPNLFKSLPLSLKKAYSEFTTKPLPRITYYKGSKINHLYHGSKTNRQYVDRHKMIEMDEDIRTLITINKDGMYEWVDKAKWNPLFLGYFKNRIDDDVSDLRYNGPTS
jgi:hypothetical protein